MFNFLRTKNIGIDLGTANTLIYVKGVGIILDEPSVIATENSTGRIIAVGEKAKEMLGKAPRNISIVKPLQDGVISDFDKATEMLAEFLKRALAERRIKSFRAVVGVPSCITEVEKRAVNEVVHSMGAGSVYILEEPMAAAIGAGMEIDGATGCMIADIGGGTTDVAIMALGGIVTSTSIRYGGEKMNEAIILYMRKKYGFLIGEQTAEQLKINIGYASQDVDESGKPIVMTMVARGRDVASGLPKTMEVSSLDIEKALAESVDIIISAIKETIEKAPPEIAADVAEVGMVISGGGGLIKNLDKEVTNKTGINARVTENAFEAVAIGTGKSLDDINKLKIYSQPKKRIDMIQESKVQ